MTLYEMIITACALAMDAFAVSIASGAAMQQMHIRHALRVGFFFGFFQAVMPLVGWSIGLTAADIVFHFDHWIAFILLGGIGIKMILEARKPVTECDDEEVKDPLNVYVLVMLSLATSIDAAAVGITLSFLKVSIILPIIIIGIVTFSFSFAGMYIGMYVCEQGEDRFTHWIQRTGGAVLILLGTNILIQHLFFGSH